MLFNTFEFVFFFLSTVTIYYVLRHQFRWLWLLIASYYFYFSWEPKLVLLLFASTLTDYVCGEKIYHGKDETVRKVYLGVSIVVNLSLLIFFKYLGFFTDTFLDVVQFFGVETPDPGLEEATSAFSRILIPIGISFYTFQTLSYSIEVYRRNVRPEKHFGRYALYVSFFPQLVAGPIERAQQLLPQLRSKISLNVESIRIGLMLMAWGYFMKLVVADRLGVYVDIVFPDPERYQGIPLIIGAYFFTFQIYFDFAAYSIIAIGAARVMGFNLTINFNRPIYSDSISEFWKKWHISLMSWLRDYLYRPLVLNGHFKRYWALLLVFVLSGLWHGAGWNFVIWGTMNGLFLLFELATRQSREKLLGHMSRFIPTSITRLIWPLISFHFIVFSLIFFRSTSVSAALNYISNIPDLGNLRVPVLRDSFELVLSFLLILLVQVVHYFKPDHKVYELVNSKSVMFRWSLYMLFAFTIVFFSAGRKDPFIYFQF